MKHLTGVMMVCLVTVLAVCASAPAADKAASSPATVESTCPGLATSSLISATLGELPKGTVLVADNLTITEKDLSDQIAKAPAEIQGQLKNNAFSLLEQMATKALVLREARKDAGKEADGKDEGAVIKSYLTKIADKAKVSDAEIAGFYKNNKDAVGGAELSKVQSEIAAYLRQQKQQELVDQHIRGLGGNLGVRVSSSWAKDQAVLAKDNPVDKARSSGKPSLVDFGSKGCRPCDMLAPILEDLKKKYDGKANVLFVSVVEQQILATRYGIRAIPVQVFFDKSGKEVFRHVGFYPQDEIEKQMAKLGVQ